MPAKQVLFILGSTGSGKSNLALDLAEEFNGEIVNADSMQIYFGNGLGIMTAKPSIADLKRVKHHLYEIIDMKTTTNFNMQKYQALALEIIQDIHSRGKLPIVVGGTNYYIESLLFETPKQQLINPRTNVQLEMMYIEQFADFRLQWPEYADVIEDFEENIPPDRKDKIEEKYSSPEDVKRLHGLLQQVDPLMGKYLHSNDKRKIVNAIFKFFKMSVIGK